MSKDSNTIGDRLSSAVAAPFRTDSLVGTYFHSRDADGEIEWQGAVVADVAPGYVLIETFSWLTGSSHVQKLMSIADMVTWDFYDSDEWMRNAYREYDSKRAVREQGKHDA